MKSRLFAAVLSAGLFCIASQASAFELFNKLGLGYGGYGCGCDVACGKDLGCGFAAPACGCDRGCRHHCHRDRCHRGCHRGCHKACGCDVAVPTCAAPIGKGPIQAPACGFEPACGCDKGCGFGGFWNRCGCKDRCHKQRCCRDRCHHLKHRFAGCGCEPACGLEPACGFMGK